MYAYYNVCKQQKAFYVEINMYLNNLWFLVYNPQYQTSHPFFRQLIIVAQL